MKNLILPLIILLLEMAPSYAQQKAPLLDSVVTYTYLNTSDSILSAKAIYSYDLMGFRISYDEYLRNQYTGGIFLRFYQRDSFDIPGNHVKKVQYSSMEMGLHYPYVMHTWEYTASPNPVSERMYQKERIEDEWQCDSLTDIKWDENGKILEKIVYARRDNSQNPSIFKRSIYSYNQAGSVTEELNEYWDDNQNSWLVGNRRETNYWPNGMKQSEYLYYWNGYDQVWRKYENRWHEYDSLGRLVKRRDFNIGAEFLWEYDYGISGDYSIYYSGRAVGMSTFNPGHIFNFFANESGQIIREDHYKYSRSDSAWIPQSLTERSYHQDGSPDQVHDWNWNSDLNDWVLNTKSFYCYRSSGSGLDDVLPELVRVYPNPTHGLVRVEGIPPSAQIEILDINGKRCEMNYLTGESIDLSRYPDGVYYIRIWLGGSRVLVYPINKN